MKKKKTKLEKSLMTAVKEMKSIKAGTLASIPFDDMLKELQPILNTDISTQKNRGLKDDFSGSGIVSDKV